VRFNDFSQSSKAVRSRAEEDERDNNLAMENGVATNVNVNDIDYDLNNDIAELVNRQDGHSDVE
jgi:hypothetical protein